MSRVQRIQKLVDAVDRTENVLEERQNRLWDEVMPIFRCARNITYGTALYSVSVTATDVIASFGHPQDSPTTMSLPLDIFEATDPKAAARAFEEQRQKERETVRRNLRKAELLKELETL